MEIVAFISSAVGPKLLWEDSMTGQRHDVTYGQLRNWFKNPMSLCPTEVFNFQVDMGSDAYPELLIPGSKEFNTYCELTLDSPSGNYSYPEARYILKQVLDAFEVDHKLVNFDELRKVLPAQLVGQPLSFDALFPDAKESKSFTSTVYYSKANKVGLQKIRVQTKDMDCDADGTRQLQALLRAAVATFIAGKGLYELRTKGIDAIPSSYDDFAVFSFDAIKALSDGTWVTSYDCGHLPDEEQDWVPQMCHVLDSFSSVRRLPTEGKEAEEFRQLCLKFKTKVETAYPTSEPETKRRKI